MKSELRNGQGREVRNAMCFYQVVEWDLQKSLLVN